MNELENNNTGCFANHDTKKELIMVLGTEKENLLMGPLGLKEGAD